MVARDESDDGDVASVQTEDLAVEDDVFRMLVVGPGADVGADFVKDRGHGQQQGGVGVHFVEIDQFLEEMRGDAPDMLAVAAVGLVAGRKNAGRAEDFLIEMLLRLDRLVTDFPEIEEMDLNPLLVGAAREDAAAVDVRIRLAEAPREDA